MTSDWSASGNLIHLMFFCKVWKGKFHPRTGHEGTDGSTGIQVYNVELDGDGWSMPRPASFTPGMTRCTLYGRLGGPQGRYGQVRKISLQPGFDPRTVQPVVSRYTDYALPTHTISVISQLVYFSTFCCHLDGCAIWWFTLRQNTLRVVKNRVPRRRHN
jgi:hypothetical protein